ncbi:helix-turn-helix domain-containing protein [Desertibaculum subflavum]|uniref:helix-turn-helix domain-containing protein n=1 Tax=Desertibaculum subflavum TaxID=2268458 RepID=UPI000E6666E0
MPEVETPAAVDLPRRVQGERESRGWSLAELAARSGVSKAMISKIERGEASPTAALLGRLSGAFGKTLSALLAPPQASASQLSRAGRQPVWRDPRSGYLRRIVSPRADGPLDLVEVVLPPGARIAFPAASYAFLHQQIWVLEGHLSFEEGLETHELDAGDCLELGPPADCAFANHGAAPCRYLVAVVKR